jgi:two-component sensor histidine kinase
MRGSGPRAIFDGIDVGSLLLWSQLLRDLGRPARYALATVIVALSVALRLSVSDWMVGFPLILFVPVITLVALVLGHGAGLYSIGLFGLCIDFFFLQPIWSLAIASTSDAVGLSVFVLTGFLNVAIIESLRQTAARAAALEREKGVLLDELNHRVQNNLQAVAGLLHLQARSGPVTSDDLDAAAARVTVIGRIHSRLNDHGQSAVVDTATFIGELCQDLQAGLVGPRPISVAVAVDPVPMELRKAVPIGLIINELVTNALKYAFPDQTPGTVRVSFAKRESRYTLEVADDGIGMSRNAPMGTGRKLVKMLVGQLAGELTIDATMSGTRVLIRFA